MSFFDDEPDDEPTRLRRPAPPRQAQTQDASPLSHDEVVQRRRLIFGGALAVLLLILIVAGKSCADNSRKNSLKTYNRQAGEIIRSSDRDVSGGLFALLSGGEEAATATTKANQLRAKADQNVDDARNLDVPGGLDPAQRNLELVLNLRANGVRQIAADLSAAGKQGRGAQAALQRITGQMQAFLASDVVYSQRVAPLIREKLDDAGLQDTTIAGTKFLPELGWLDYGQAASRINPDVGGAGSTPTGEPTPGRHGHGLTSVAIGGTTLQPGGTPTTVAVATGLALDVTFQNQGENDESNVKVTAKVQPTTGRAYEVVKTVSQTKAGESANVSLPLKQVPTRSSTARITVTIQKVNGEQTLDNNTATYTVFFK